MPREALEELLRRLLAQRLEVPPASFVRHERFHRYGLDSAAAGKLVAELGAALGRRLPPTIVWDHPTLDRLAGYLAGETGGFDRAPMQPLPPGEPIAVVGLAIRAPGAADAEAFWRLVRDGIDAVSDVPEDRWSIDHFYDPDPARPGRMSTRWGGFLEAIDQFDAGFFGISPREAAQMDPQQRLALELAWEALEDAGWRPSALVGRRAGVFLGAMWSDYARLLGDGEAIGQHTATGQDISLVSARISYALGLEGPSLTVNTACSSALVAVHLACQSLRSGESAVALAGGVHLVLAPESTIAMTKFGAMAPDGRCKAFDARADGYVRGEGGAIVALKGLRQAVADGDPVHAVILGSAVNNDGPSNGLTAPNPDAQRAMLQDALAAAGIDAATIDLVEAHGTGTRLGDPIEAGALGAILGRGRASGQRLRLGSVKTNIGHLEAAAGAVGLVKAVLALKHRTLPPSLHFQTPSPHIDFGGLGLEVQTRPEPWPERPHPPRAGVSSFGFGGTNSHVILEAAPAPRTLRGAPVFVFSGNGGVWPGMGRDLLRHAPAFTAMIDRLDGALGELDCLWRLRDLLGDGPLAPNIEEVALAQPALFAYQLGVTELLAREGIRPAAVVGHSVGEIAAAVTAGILSPEAGLRIVVERSRLQATQAGRGGMALVAAPVEAVQTALEPEVGIAGRNAPRATLLAGSLAALERASRRLEALGHAVFPIRVPVAYHSPQMAPLREPLIAALAGLEVRAGEVPIASTVTGGLFAGDAMGPDYWGRNLGDPVLFGPAIEALSRAGYRRFVEIGPHALLTGAVQQTAPTAEVLAFIRRGEPEFDAITNLAQRLGGSRNDVRGRHLLILSARSEAALDRLAAAWAARLPDDFPDLCHTALVGRERFAWRLALHATDGLEAQRRLRAGEVRRGYVPPDQHLPAFARERRSDENWPAYLDAAAEAFLAGADIDGHVVDRDQPWRVVQAPGYPFERERHWLATRRIDAIDPAWLMELVDEPRPLPGWSELASIPGADPDRTATLDRLAAGYAATALDLVPVAAVAPRHRALFDRLAAEPKSPDAASAGAAIGVEDGPDRRLIERVGTALPAILRGEVEPLSLLFPGGDFAQAAALYGEAPLFAAPARALARAVGAWAAARAAPLRVLEIGAGTGGLTRHLLAALGTVELDYLYTDLSPAFLAWGQARFGDRQGFRVARFDVEQPAGLDGTFDLVVAANALHATADVLASLQAAAALLAPGGVLALVELTRAPGWIDLVFGTTEGWWRHVGDPHRADHALLTAEGWSALLPQAGLAPVALAADCDAHGIIIARSVRRFAVLGEGALAARLRQELPSGPSATDVVLAPGDADAANLVASVMALPDAGRRWLVTTGGMAHAAARGALATLALQAPASTATAIELQDAEPASIDALLAELAGGGSEDRVRIANGGRRVVRLVEAGADWPTPLPIRPDRLYLIAGGLGMLGSAIAGWLAEQGARHLVLVARTVRETAAVAALRRRGAEVRVVAVDLASGTAAAELSKVIDRPLGGVVHAAGIAHGEAGSILAAKLETARALAIVAQGQPLDIFLVASSAAGIWGAAGHAPYAAANAALDAWVVEARARGLPAVSLALGRLAQPGLLTPDEDAGLAAAGLLPMPLAAVPAVAFRLAAAGRPHLVLAHLDRRLFLDVLEARRRHPLFDRLRPPLDQSVIAGQRPARPVEAARSISARQPGPGSSGASEGVRALVADVLGHADPSSLDPARGLFEQGLDSLMALTLRRRLETLAGQPVPASVLFSHPSVNGLEAWLKGVGSQRAAGPAAPVAPAEGIAVIGIGCRFPGGIHGPDAFAAAIYAGADLIAEVPDGRWSNSQWYDPDPATPGRIASRWGGFIEGADLFDAGFFNISPREAAQMDPQQRLLLETAWEALEDATIPPDRLAGTRTAIYIGATGSDYALICRRAGLELLDGHSLTGQPSNNLAGRLAHQLGTEGPAMVVDTACSSSLVACHLAVQALSSGEADLALAGGVNLLLAPDTSIMLSRARLLAADGRCKTFDARADGYVRAEGCGVVVLKPLGRAQADGDPVLAVIRGSAVNHDGRSSGFTAPNGAAQEAVIRAALERAGLSPGDVDLIEAHGTGTGLGDPIELDALAGVFAGRDRPLVVGSVKTNFGHAEAAAGIAGLIKAVVAVGRPTIPPHLHFSRLNPHCSLAGLPLHVPTVALPWPDVSARCGVSAFGASGTNAHLVIERSPATPEPFGEVVERSLPGGESHGSTADGLRATLLVTGATAEAVIELGRRTRQHLAAHGIGFVDACDTAAVGRARLRWWATASSVEELDRLVPAQGSPPEPVVSARRRVRLPTYPFAGTRHWLPIAPERPAVAGTQSASTPGQHLAGRSERPPFWGPPVTVARSGERLTTGRLDHRIAWIAEHGVEDRVILPGAGFLGLCVAAGIRSLADVAYQDRVEVPLDGRVIQLARATDGGLELFAETSQGWLTAVTARTAEPGAAALEPFEFPGDEVTSVDGASHMAGLERRGFRFGPSFARIRHLERIPRAARASLHPDDAAIAAAGLEAEPALLDQALQAFTSLLPGTELWLPVGIGRFDWLGGQAVQAEARITQISESVAQGDARLLDAPGDAVALFRGLRFHKVEAASQDLVHEVRWRAVDIVWSPFDAGWHAIGAGGDELPVGTCDAGGLAPIPAGTVGVVDLRPLTAGSPAECLRDSADLARRLAGRNVRLLLVSRGASGAPPLLAGVPPAAAILMGLAPTIAAEHPELACGWLDLDPTQAELPTVVPLGFDRVALRAGIALAPDIVRLAPDFPRPCRLEADEQGSLDGLAWRPMALLRPGPGEVLVEIKASGLNFKDSMMALGRTPGEPRPLGLEAAGIVQAIGQGVGDLSIGEPVLVLAAGALASHICVPAARCWPYPPGLSAEAAASLAVAYLTAWHGLVDLAGLGAGQRVLVHAGAGGVGAAAIQLARARGALVFATVGPGKAGWALAAGAEAVASSRGPGFAAAVAAWSGAPGVDVVLHALGPAMAAASVPLLRPGGSFIELGATPTPEPRRPDIRYWRYDLDQPQAADPGWYRRCMGQLADLLERGAISLPVRSEAGIDAAAESLAALAGGRTVGKLVLRWPAPVPPQLRGTWLVTGGTGAVGQAIAGYLRDQGAERVVLAARRPRPDLAFEMVTGDLGEPDAVARLLEACPDLRGIVHAAGIVEDAMLATLGPAEIAATLRAKQDGARHLDELTRGRRLDGFVLVSSIVGTIGGPGQAAYAAANAWLDALARHRRAAGLPAQAIAFGPWQGGQFGQLPAAHRTRWQDLGYRPMTVETALSGLDRAWRRGGATALVMRRAAAMRPSTVGSSLRRRLDALPASEQSALLEAELAARIVRLLGFAAGMRVERQRALRDLGLDSLLAVGFRNELAAALDLDLPASLAFDHPTLDALTRHLLSLLAPPAEGLDDLTADDLAALLAAELEPSGR